MKPAVYINHFSITIFSTTVFFILANGHCHFCRLQKQGWWWKNCQSSCMFKNNHLRSSSHYTQHGACWGWHSESVWLILPVFPVMLLSMCLLSWKWNMYALYINGEIHCQWWLVVKLFSGHKAFSWMHF